MNINLQGMTASGQKLARAQAWQAAKIEYGDRSKEGSVARTKRQESDIVDFSASAQDSLRVMQMIAKKAGMEAEANDIIGKNTTQIAIQGTAPKSEISAGPGSVAVQKGFDLGKVMQIHEKGFKEVPTREESKYYWAARKADPELDQFLYDQDKAKALAEVAATQNLLVKATMGLKLTQDEQKKIDQDPQLKQEIQVRKSKMDLLNKLM